MRTKTNILLLFLLQFLLTTSVVFAQCDSAAKAIILAQDTSIPVKIRIKQSLEIIDKAITHPQAQNNAFAWYVRGFIYKEWYKTFELQNKKSSTRLNAVGFFKKALEMDTFHENPITITQTINYFGKIGTVFLEMNPSTIRHMIKYLGVTFYNDASSLLDTTNYPAAIQNYEEFKKCILIAEPEYNIKTREIEFKNALATVYEKIFRANIKTNERFFGMIEDLYKHVLALDTNNWSGNYNLAMLYYNYGVDIINKMDLEIPIMEVDKIQDESRDLFRKALPYAMKSYSLNPKRKEVIMSLQGIYFSLYEFEKSDEFKAKLGEIEKEK
ncbi:MAG: hypothetical protein V1781_07390 [Bacteroidota bacterium]